jgi:hypothetical protein
VPLERITPFFKAINSPALNVPFEESPDKESWGLAGGSPEEGKVLAQSAELMEDWFGEHVDKPADYQKLMGLASLVLSYIMNAARQDPGKPLAYAKLIAPVMSRNSFSSLWAQISETEQQLFEHPVAVPEVEGGSGEEGNSPALNFTDWMLDMVDYYEQRFNVPEHEASGADVFPGGYLSQSGAEKPGPSIEHWLPSIVEPEGQKDLLSPPAGGSPSMGAKEAASASAALELRRLPKGLAVGDWTLFAARIFELYEKVIGVS